MTMPPPELPTDNRLALRRVVRACRKAALATILAAPAGDGRMPYASLVTVAVDHDLAPILLLSGLADHTRNIAADPRVSLLFDGTAHRANPQTGPRVTLQGTAARSDDPRLRARFLARLPAAAEYAGFGDFAFYRVAPERVHFVGGFARAVWFEAPFGLDAAAVAAVAEAEADILAHMNADHADAVLRMAQHLGGDDWTAWRMIGIDPDGCDLACDDRILRQPFERPIDGPEAARATLVALARKQAP
jgi:putative heme iron utilization protein